MVIRPASVLLLLTRTLRTTLRLRAFQLTALQLRAFQLTALQLRALQLTALQLRPLQCTILQRTTRHRTTRLLMSLLPTTTLPTTTLPTMVPILRIRVRLKTTPLMTHPHQARLPRRSRPLTPPSKRILNIHVTKELALTYTPQ